MPPKPHSTRNTAEKTQQSIKSDQKLKTSGSDNQKEVTAQKDEFQSTQDISDELENFQLMITAFTKYSVTHNGPAHCRASCTNTLQKWGPEILDEERQIGLQISSCLIINEIDLKECETEDTMVSDTSIVILLFAMLNEFNESQASSKNRIGILHSQLLDYIHGKQDPKDPSKWFIPPLGTSAIARNSIYFDSSDVVPRRILFPLCRTGHFVLVCFEQSADRDVQIYIFDSLYGVYSNRFKDSDAELITKSLFPNVRFIIIHRVPAANTTMQKPLSNDCGLCLIQNAKAFLHCPAAGLQYNTFNAYKLSPENASDSRQLYSTLLRKWFDDHNICKQKIKPDHPSSALGSIASEQIQKRLLDDSNIDHELNKKSLSELTEEMIGIEPMKKLSITAKLDEATKHKTFITQDCPDVSETTLADDRSEEIAVSASSLNLEGSVGKYLDRNGDESTGKTHSLVELLKNKDKMLKKIFASKSSIKPLAVPPKMPSVLVAPTIDSNEYSEDDCHQTATNSASKPQEKHMKSNVKVSPSNVDKEESITSGKRIHFNQLDMSATAVKLEMFERNKNDVEKLEESARKDQTSSHESNRPGGAETTFEDDNSIEKTSTVSASTFNSEGSVEKCFDQSGEGSKEKTCEVLEEKLLKEVSGSETITETLGFSALESDVNDIKKDDSPQIATNSLSMKRNVNEQGRGAQKQGFGRPGSRRGTCHALPRYDRELQLASQSLNESQLHDTSLNTSLSSTGYGRGHGKSRCGRGTFVNYRGMERHLFTQVVQQQRTFEQQNRVDNQQQYAEAEQTQFHNNSMNSSYNQSQHLQQSVQQALRLHQDMMKNSMSNNSMNSSYRLPHNNNQFIQQPTNQGYGMRVVNSFQNNSQFVQQPQNQGYGMAVMNPSQNGQFVQQLPNQKHGMTVTNSSYFAPVINSQQIAFHQHGAPQHQVQAPQMTMFQSLQFPPFCQVPSSYGQAPTHFAQQMPNVAQQPMQFGQHFDRRHKKKPQDSRKRMNDSYNPM